MLRDSFFSLVTTVVRLASGLVLFIVLAHAWGPAPFGTFMYPFTIAAILVKVVDYGFVLQVMRDAGKAPTRLHEIMRHALGAKLLLVAPTAITAIVISLALRRGEQSTSVLLALLLCDAIANSFAQFLNVPLRVLGRFDKEARVVVLGNTAVFATVSGIALAGWGPVAAAIGFVLARLVYLAISCLAYEQAVGAFPWPSRGRRELLTILKLGFPFGVHATIGTLSLQADTLMVQHYLGAESVGLYQAGMRLLFGALLVADALNNVYISALARAIHHRTEMSRLSERMTRHLLALGVIALACLLGGSGLIVPLLFGHRYEALVPLLPLFGLLIFIRYGGLSYGTLLTLADKQMFRVIAVCGTLLLWVALNAVLIPRFGLRGALGASISSHIILYSVYVVAAWKDYRSFLIDSRSIALLAVASAAIVLALLPELGSTLVRLQVAVALIMVAAAIGVTRKEWGTLSSELARVIS